jgi:hypothetical protein
LNSIKDIKNEAQEVYLKQKSVNSKEFKEILEKCQLIFSKLESNN